MSCTGWRRVRDTVLRLAVGDAHHLSETTLAPASILVVFKMVEDTSDARRPKSNQDFLRQTVSIS